MGIKNLTKLIKVNSPDSIETSQLHKLSGRKVAIDASLFIYQCLMNVRYNGKSLKNDNDKVTSHISGIFYKTINYLSMNVTPIYIFDGKPPEEKDEIIKNRQVRAECAKAGLEKATTDIEREKYEKQCIRLTKTHIDDIKRLLDLMGVSYLHIDGEAEAVASELCRIGYVDYVLTEDMDVMAYACPRMIRNCIDSSIKRKDIVSIITYQTLIDDLQLDHNSFIDFCILCGCDYCPIIPRVGSVTALKLIHKYKNIETILENTKYQIPDNYLEQFNAAKENFLLFRDKIDINTIDIHTSLPSVKDVENYLINEIEMHEKRVKNTLKKFHNKYKHE